MNTSIVEEDSLTWWDQVAYLLVNLFNHNYKIEKIDLLFVGLVLKQTNLNQMIFEATQRLFSANFRVRTEVLLKLNDVAESLKIVAVSKGNSASWEKIKQLPAEVELGVTGHGVALPSELEVHDYIEDLNTARRIVKDRTQKNADLYAFPFGDFSERDFEVIQSMNFKSVYGIGDVENVIPRLIVNDILYPNIDLFKKRLALQ